MQLKWEKKMAEEHEAKFLRHNTAEISAWRNSACKMNRRNFTTPLISANLSTGAKLDVNGNEKEQQDRFRKRNSLNGFNG